MVENTVQNNHFKNTCFVKKKEKESIHEIVNIYVRLTRYNNNCMVVKTTDAVRNNTYLERALTLNSKQRPLHKNM